MGSDEESKLAAPKLFGRKKGTRTPPADEPAAVEETRVDLEPVAAPDEAEPAAQTPVEDTPVPTAEEPLAAAPKRERRPRPDLSSVRVPALSGLPAAAVTGLLVGAFLLLATYGALHLCSTVRGASTCGGRAGFPLLLAIGVVAVVGGGTLLRLFHVTSPMGDSFLAVALVAVLTVVFLHNHYDAWWMAIAVPVLSVLAFLLAHWVSVTYIDPVED